MTYVICPVLNRWDLTRAMLNALDAEEVTDALILDNGSTDETAQRIRQWQAGIRSRYATYYRPLGPKLHRTDQSGRSIYEMWNHGFARAKRLAAREPFYVLVTNNDILLPTGALKALRSALEGNTRAVAAYPNYDLPWHPVHLGPVDPLSIGVERTKGVLSDGGMFGACFMLAGHRVSWDPLVTDTGYLWWYGDNHLAETIEQAGGEQLKVLGLCVQHANEATASEYPHLDAFKWHDRQRWITRHQRWAEQQ